MKKAAPWVMLLASAFMFYLGDRAALLYQELPGSILAKITGTVHGIFPAIAANTTLFSTDTNSLLAGLAGVAVIWLVYVYNAFGQRKYLHGEEHGSARWGDQGTIKKYISKNPDENILFTSTEKMTLDTRVTGVNNNVLVIGGSGSGKTRYFIKPNIMQMHPDVSFVVTDPKGEIIRDVGDMLKNNGYKIKVFNLIDMKSSHRYNPFNYIKEEKDILKLINNLITNTTSSQARKGDDFWEKAETALLQALFGFVHFEGLPDEKNIPMVMELMRLAEVREDEETYRSTLDVVFSNLKRDEPNHFAVKQYDLFKLAAGKTAKSILVSLGVRLSPFYIQDLSDLLSEDTIGLDMIGTEKTALFVLLPDSDKTFNFLAAIMYQQLFDILYYKADWEHEGRLPLHVRCMLDEFPNIGQIPQFETYISTMRSRNVSASIVVQNLTQLKSIYEKTWETITGNCASLLFLGGKEQSTLEYLSKMIGKTTYDHRSINETRGETGSYSMNYQIVARDLITPDEIGLLKKTECLLSIQGERPFKSRKYDITRHPRYKSVAEGGGQAFDLRKTKLA